MNFKFEFSFKNGKPLEQNERVGVVYEKVNTYELVIEHVTAEDEGVYKCIAMNSEGKDETTGKLTVTSKFALAYIHCCLINKYFRK